MIPSDAAQPDEFALYQARIYKAIDTDVAWFNNARVSSFQGRSLKRAAAQRRRRLAAQQKAALREIFDKQTRGARGQHPSRRCETNEHQSTVTVIPRAMENDTNIKGVDPWQEKIVTTNSMAER